MIQSKRLKPTRSAMPQMKPKDDLCDQVRDRDPRNSKSGDNHAVNVVDLAIFGRVSRRVFGYFEIEIIATLARDRVLVLRDDAEGELSQVEDDERQKHQPGQQHVPGCPAGLDRVLINVADAAGAFV